MMVTVNDPLMKLMIALFLMAIAMKDAGAYLQIDQTFVSPDGKLQARVLTWDQLQIQERNTGKTIPVIFMPPLSSLRWTGDSKAIVTHEHIAGGPFVVISGTPGSRLVAAPSVAAPWLGDGDSRSIVREKIGRETVSITYKIAERTYGPVFEFWLCSFDVNTLADKITNVVVHRIDESTYDALKTLYPE
jgi:hypothetical protein